MKNDKFKFVDIEDIKEESVNSSIKKEEPKKEDVPTVDISKRRYYSFETRVFASVLAILVLFVGACFLGLKVVNHTTTQKVKYVETCDFSYQVCLKNATCEPENITYTAKDINIIKIAFKYDAKYDKKINLNSKYIVKGIFTAYNKEDHKVLYQKEFDESAERNLNAVSNSYLASEVVSIDYSVYKDLLKDYPDADNQAEVVFYVIENNEARKVGSLLIPLSLSNFELNKYTTNAAKTANVKVNVWDTYTLIYALAASILTIVSLILIFKTTRLVLKVTNNKSDYEEAVDNILKEYDNIIVVSRDGYESIVEREVVKLDSFEELVKIRDEINKPIIYSKINNVKCEFILEGDKVIYKHVMKEADFTEDEKINLENK